jgi:hypothetical protein
MARACEVSLRRESGLLDVGVDGQERERQQVGEKLVVVCGAAS